MHAYLTGWSTGAEDEIILIGENPFLCLKKKKRKRKNEKNIANMSRERRKKERTKKNNWNKMNWKRNEKICSFQPSVEEENLAGRTFHPCCVVRRRRGSLAWLIMITLSLFSKVFIRGCVLHLRGYSSLLTVFWFDFDVPGLWNVSLGALAESFALIDGFCPEVFLPLASQSQLTSHLFVSLSREASYHALLPYASSRPAVGASMTW